MRQQESSWKKNLFFFFAWLTNYKSSYSFFFFLMLFCTFFFSWQYFKDYSFFFLMEKRKLNLQICGILVSHKFFSFHVFNNDRVMIDKCLWVKINMFSGDCSGCLTTSIDLFGHPVSFSHQPLSTAAVA